MHIAESELILNEDGSIYHLHLKPEYISNTIITVGDPDRVDQVTQYFDTIEHKVKKREFHTQTGTYKGHRITVISTGIGTDNIDIVLNELDALVNIDFETRKVKKEHTPLNIIRIGTSGTVQSHIPVNTFILSEYAIGFDNLLHFYDSKHIQHTELIEMLKAHLHWDNKTPSPYVVHYDEKLGNYMQHNEILTGITITNAGFYGPQGRKLRLSPQNPKMNQKITSFDYFGKKITNLEMETAGIYGLSKLLGHRAISMNAILANRITGEFSSNPKKTIDKLIQRTLNRITEYLKT